MDILVIFSRWSCELAKCMYVYSKLSFMVFGHSYYFTYAGTTSSYGVYCIGYIVQGTCSFLWYQFIIFPCPRFHCAIKIVIGPLAILHIALEFTIIFVSVCVLVNPYASIRFSSKTLNTCVYLFLLVYLASIRLKSIRTPMKINECDFCTCLHICTLH